MLEKYSWTYLNPPFDVNIRSFQPGDEVVQAGLFNISAFSFPGFKPATADEVKRRSRSRGFDASTRLLAEVDSQAVGYCNLDPEQGRISYPWCKKGFESAAPVLLDAALNTARKRGLKKVFTAYRRDWTTVLKFFSDNEFQVVREMINYWTDPVDLPTRVSRNRLPIDRLQREDIPAVASMGEGIIRLPLEKLENYLFSNPYFPVESFLVLRDRDGKTPVAVGLGLESGNYADVKKIDPLSPCFRLGAFGTEGLSTKRINGLFSYIVADPANTLTAGLALLSEASQEMTESSVTSLAAQCPSDAPHLVGFYSRYFKEQGRFPILEKKLE